MASLRDVLSDNGEQAAARPRIVLISMEENEEQFFTAIRSGISAYLLKDASADDVGLGFASRTVGGLSGPRGLALGYFHGLRVIRLYTPLKIREVPRTWLPNINS